MSTSSTTPEYVYASPLGFHVKNLLQLIRHHPTHVSSDPARRKWTTQKSQQMISSMFLGTGNTPGAVIMANLFIINKTRDVDRICPSCHRIYRVGEAPRAYPSFDEFINRPRRTSEVDAKVEEEQDLSGACCGPCFNALSEQQWEENGCGGELVEVMRLASQNGFTLRYSRPEEQHETGIKTVWEKLEDDK
ncbi:MAG: hypothetical protein LQ348_004569 [Seirophora lacunosa]|nr:MAG: hypothetical protein LQ348_004569 [Seirophora lacunosa]